MKGTTGRQLLQPALKKDIVTDFVRKTLRFNVGPSSQMDVWFPSYAMMHQKMAGMGIHYPITPVSILSVPNSLMNGLVFRCVENPPRAGYFSRKTFFEFTGFHYSIEVL